MKFYIMITELAVLNFLAESDDILSFVSVRKCFKDGIPILRNITKRLYRETQIPVSEPLSNVKGNC